MIHWLLLILKILGIILAAVFGLVLLLLLLVLFVPVRYRGRVCYGPQPLWLRAGASWLWFVLRVRVTWLEQKLLVVVSVFGIPVYRSDAKKEEQEQPEKAKKGKTKQGTKLAEPPEGADAQEAESLKTADGSHETENGPRTETETETAKGPEAEKKNFFAGSSDKLHKIKETIHNIIQKLKTLLHRAEALKELLSREESRCALSFAWEKLKRLLKHILPRRLRGTIVYGSGDPCTTGQMLGAVAVLYARYGELFSITPDFEEKRLECDVTFKGSIQVIILLIIAIKVMRNQEIRQLIQELKQIKTAE